MFAKFGEEIATLTERSTTTGIEEFLLDRAEKKGVAKGREEGREESVRETALKIREAGLDVTLISNITGLSVEEIINLS